MKKPHSNRLDDKKSETRLHATNSHILQVQNINILLHNKHCQFWQWRSWTATVNKQLRQKGQIIYRLSSFYSGFITKQMEVRTWKVGWLSNVVQSIVYKRSQNCEKQPLASSYLSACPSAWRNSTPTDRIFMKFDIWIFFWKCVEKIQVWLKSDKDNGYFTWRPMNIYNNSSLNYSQNEKHFR